MKQRTILREASIHGKSLHTGKEVHLTLKPAAENTGLVFRRVDVYGKPEIRPSIEMVSELVRSTDIRSGHTKIHTVEHVLSALSGLAVDNCLIEMDSSEPPILDGSAKQFANLIQTAEPVEQAAEREVFKLQEPISITEGNRSIIAVPYDGFKVTCTSADDRGIHTQHLSIDIDVDTYISEIAPARTFTVYEDIEPLLKMGKIQGGSLDSAIVLKGDKILSKEPLRFPDEFVRHKILDIVGDLVLLGKRLHAHIVAVRPGHALNSRLTQRIFDQMKRVEAEGKSSRKARDTGKEPAKGASVVAATERSLSIRRVLDLLPHSFPFVMIDRVADIPSETELVAIKNVSINEPYFPGHFPGNPVMPGVLQLEAMAQAAGILMLQRVSSEGKTALFMSADKVKFRRAVTPGDQLEVRVKITKIRESSRQQMAAAAGECRVNGKVVSSAELLFAIAELPDLSA